MRSICAKSLCLILLFLSAACTKAGRSVNDLYKFPVTEGASSTKDVQVQVQINYQITATGGPAVSLTDTAFLLNAYLFSGTEQEVQIAPVGQTPVTDLPITLTSPHLSFDAILRIPASAQPGANGYAFHFALKNPAPSLTLTTISSSGTTENLEALKGGVQPGTTAATNIVPLSLATTLAYQLTVAAGVNDGSSNHITAYDALSTAVGDRLKLVEADLVATSKPDLGTFTAAVLADLKLQIMQDQTLQVALTAALQPAVTNLKQGQASTLLAAAFTDTLKGYATDVQAALGTTTAASQLFTSGTVDPASVPDPATYVSIIFSPAAVAFTDTDTSSALGGQVVVTTATLCNRYRVVQHLLWR